MKLLETLSKAALDYIHGEETVPKHISILVEESNIKDVPSKRVSLNTLIVCELERNGISSSIPIKILEGIDEDNRRSAIAIAKSVSERVCIGYNPEGFEKKMVESRRIVWPEIPRVVYRAYISLKKKAA